MMTPARRLTVIGLRPSSVELRDIPKKLLRYRPYGPFNTCSSVECVSDASRTSGQEPSMTDPLSDHETDLVDLTDLPLSQVMTMDDSVLAQSLRRLAQDVDQQEYIVAGYQSFLM